MRMLFFCGRSPRYIVPRITACGHEVMLARQVIGITRSLLLISDGKELNTVEPSRFDVALFYASPVDLPIGLRLLTGAEDEHIRLDDELLTEPEDDGYTAIQVANRLPRTLPIIDLDPGARGLPSNLINRAIKLDNFIRFLVAHRREKIIFASRPRKG